MTTWNGDTQIDDDGEKRTIIVKQNGLGDYVVGVSLEFPADIIDKLLYGRDYKVANYWWTTWGELSGFVGAGSSSVKRFKSMEEGKEEVRNYMKSQEWKIINN